MKHQTEKPSEHGMKFFTPDLFIQFNSADETVADRADEEWEAATLEYRDHLDRLRDQMPDEVKRLAGLCLHDAELLTSEQPDEPFLPIPFAPVPFWFRFAILSVKRDEEIVSLIYVLWDHVRKHLPEEGWHFSKSRTHWLYDEVDVAHGQRGMFLHRVLLSDGVVIEIPFVSALIHSIPLQQTRRDDASRQIA